MCLGLVTGAPAEVPVLLDPRGALRSLPGVVERGKLHWAAELAILAGDGRRGVSILGLAPPASDPRWTRLELDARVLLLESLSANASMVALGSNPGWEPHVSLASTRLERGVLRRDLRRFGLLLFAAALGILLLGAGRFLIEPGAPGLAAFLWA